MIGRKCSTSAFACVMFLTTALHADIINVPGDQPTIQAGIDAALLGDEVVVADGIYTGAGNKNLDFGGKQITVRSANGPENCIIDCENDGRGFTFHSGESLLSVVEGFTIKNGLETAGGAISIQSSSPTIRNMIMSNNVAVAGGAIWTNGSSANFFSCIIKDNLATGAGGGAQCTGNDANSTFIECTFVGNVTTGAGSGWGGGLHSASGNSFLLLNCVISGNAAQEGGGIGLTGGSGSQIVDCIITNNVAEINGGGIYGSEWHSPALVRNCTIAHNSAVDAGGGVFLVNGSNPVVTNSILWGNEAPIGSQIAVSSAGAQTSHPTMAYSDVQGGLDDAHVESGSTLTWLAGNIDADPLFVNPAGTDDDASTVEDNDFHIQFDSPCVDAGDPGTPLMPGEADIDGEERVIHGLIDMGADEYDFDCNENGVLDDVDIADGTSGDDNENGLPDECECFADINDDGVVGPIDLAMLLAAWGPCPEPPDPCPADIHGSGDGIVQADDLATLLGAWGPCE